MAKRKEDNGVSTVLIGTIQPLEMRVRLRFVDEVLGTCPSQADIYRQFVGSKAPDAKTLEQEVEALGADETAQKRTTVFPRTADGKPFLWPYQIKGFFKGSAAALRNVPRSKASGIKAYKKYIDGHLFVKGEKIPLVFEGDVGLCERPLRAATAQGERVSLASSETVPAGTTAEFVIMLLDGSTHVDFVRECLDYGQLVGEGQWRNSGKGRFLWSELDADGNVIGGNDTLPK